MEFSGGTFGVLFIGGIEQASAADVSTGSRATTRPSRESVIVLLREKIRRQVKISLHYAGELVTTLKWTKPSGI